MVNTDDINSFWNWFKANANDLESQKYPSNKLEELDKKIIGFGLRWEVGPGKEKTNSLTISPGGDPGKIHLAKAFITAAPNLDLWEFYSFKQPKENWDKLELPEYHIKITADSWTYALLRYKDGKKEILIKGDSLNEIDSNSKVGVVEMVLINLIGEERMMTEVDFVHVLSPGDNTYELHNLPELTGHLEYIRNHG
jgi:hypothetical protein